MVKHYAETKTDITGYLITWRNVHFILLSENSTLLNPCTLYDTTATLKNADTYTYKNNKTLARQTPKY